VGKKMLKTVTECIIKPFRLGEVSIDAIWIDGKPYFSAYTLMDWLSVDGFGPFPGYIRERQLDIELPNPLSKGDSKTIGCYDLTGVVLIMMEQTVEPAVNFKLEVAKMVERNWEDIPDQEG
jgi:hypothetical protein